jgi:hypothetical protein
MLAISRTPKELSTMAAEVIAVTDHLVFAPHGER